MFVYFICIAVILIIYSLLNIYSRNHTFDKKKYFLIIVGFILIFLSTFRANTVSSDLSLYLNIFDSTKDISIFDIIINSLSLDHLFMTEVYNGTYEVGYVLFNKLIYTFFDIDIAFKFFSSLFINITILWFIYKQSNNELLSVILYICFGYYLQSFIIIRQYMALCLLIISLHYLLNNDNKKYFILIFLAFLFHKTSICFIILYFLKKYWNYIYKKSNYLIGFIIILFIISPPIIYFLINKFYPYYSDIMIIGEGIKLFFVLLIILFLPFFFKRITFKSLQKFNIFFILCAIGVIIQLFTYHFSLLNRLAIYFQFYFIIFIPRYFITKKYNKMLQILIILISCFYFNFIVLSNNSGQIANYQFTKEVIFYD